MRLADYQRGSREAVGIYSIPDKAFKGRKEDVIKGAARLLSGYEVDPRFADDPERSLFALAIADAWLATDSLVEKRCLLDILKLVATGEREDRRLGTLSGKVNVLSEHGRPRGTEFDPKAPTGSTFLEYIKRVEEYVADNTDKLRTGEVAETVADWGEGSMLRHAREKLGIASKNDERPFKVVVLDKTAKEILEKVGYTSFYLRDGDGAMTLVLGRDFSQDELEHEYAHMQSVGLECGYMALLFRGISEALTENAISSPCDYADQRSVLDHILQTHPGYESLFYRAYRGDAASRVNLFSRVISGYGLEGFLTIARLAPVDNPKMSGGIGASIYIEPKKVLDYLRG